MFQIVAVLIMFLVVCGESVPAFVSHAAPRSQKHVVEVEEFRFQPEDTIVATGDTIVWINRDLVPHSVTAEGGTWPTHTLEEGQSWEMVVTDRGTFPYFCRYHPEMTGLVATR